MLVICEDCAKKYNIDESRIKGRRARFACNECGHIIIIDKADLSRSLIQKKNEENFSSSSTVDLLREMEAPFTADSDFPETAGIFEQPSQEPDPEENDQIADVKVSGLPLIVTICIGTLLSCLIITAGTMYLYVTYVAELISQRVDLQTDMMVTSVMVLGGGWLIVFLLMAGLARSVSRSLVTLSDDVHRVVLGETDREIIGRGPVEVRKLAQVVNMLAKNRTGRRSI